ncbi:MAG TPA: hypothetical protein VEP90_12085 [Methylomirabilota bacterium]|nr:hypothetical protein [Methylomirabilota bacterium]
MDNSRDMDIKDNEVVFRFRDKATKDRCMGQMCDGWGEGFINFSWDWKKIKFDDVKVFIINSFDDESNDSDSEEEFWDGGDDNFTGEYTQT